jgi:hypothetical protein
VEVGVCGKLGLEDYTVPSLKEVGR